MVSRTFSAVLLAALAISGSEVLERATSCLWKMWEPSLTHESPLSQAFLAGSPLPLAGAARRAAARPARASGGLSLRASMGEGILLAAVAAVDKTGTVVAEKLSPEAQALADMAAKSAAPAAGAAGAAAGAAGKAAAAASAGAAAVATKGAGAGKLGW